MSLEARRGGVADLVDELGRKPVRSTEVMFEGLIFDVRRDTVDLGAAGVVQRDYIDHPGAVVIVALQQFDGVDHVLLIQQYRHPAGGRIWELPAGLLDVAGEPARDAAARELLEEVDLTARRWDVLADSYASPGAFPEAVRIFLARELADVPVSRRHERTAEELELVPLWVPLDDAVTAVLAGQVHNSAALIGVLATAAARDRGWASLRPHDASWPERPHRATGSGPGQLDPR